MDRVDTTVQVTVFTGTWAGSGASLGRVGSVPLYSCRGPCSRNAWFGNLLVSLSLGKWYFLPFSELSLLSTYDSGISKWCQMLLALDVLQQPSLYRSGSCTLTAEHPLLKCCWTLDHMEI